MKIVETLVVQIVETQNYFRAIRALIDMEPQSSYTNKISAKDVEEKKKYVLRKEDNKIK